jgi:hypothetical protein
LRRFAAVAAMALLAVPRLAHGVIVMGSQGNNFTADPYGVESLEGSLGGFQGTPISSQYFITAHHIGLGSGDTFTFDNQTYTVDSYQEVGNSDLEIWKIDPSSPTASFPYWATLAQSAPSANAFMVVTGEGTNRGSAVTGGWAWGGGSNDAVSWGTNNVSGTVAAGDIADSNLGTYIYYGFFRTTDIHGNVTDPNEAILSSGDSGGGLFIQNPTTHVWELAGINYGVDDYSATSGGSPANDALYNTTGYFDGTNPAENNPEYSYDSAIYSNYSAIAAIVPLPEPTTGVLLLSAFFPLIRARGLRRKS